MTSFNVREQQYKNRSLSGTYGKNYKSPVKEENEEFTPTNPTMSLRTKREIGDQKKEFNELTKDLNFKNQSAIPNSFLHQPDAERTRWMHCEAPRSKPGCWRGSSAVAALCAAGGPVASERRPAYERRAAAGRGRSRCKNRESN